MLDPGDILQLVILVILLFLSNFFSSNETAFTTVNTIRIQTMADDGNKKAVLLLKVLDQKDKMLSAILICNNVVNLAASSITTSLTIKLFNNKFVALVTGLLTLIILIFGELAPKLRAMVKAEKMALANAPVIYFTMTILTPVIFIVNKAARIVVRLFGTNPDEKVITITEDELLTLVDVSQKEGVIEDSEKEMINNVFDFGDTEAKDIMIPWIDVTSAAIDSTYDDLIEIFKEEKFTRLPIYDIENGMVAGVLNMKDLLLVDRENFDIKQIMREPYYALEHKSISSLLKEMRENGLSIVIVIDEYGMTAGIITMENVLEEIVGDISDEYKDRDEEEFTVINEDREYSCLGSMSLVDFNEETGLDLEAGEYDTLGGYILNHSEDNIPQVGEYVITESGAKITVEEVEKNRIIRVHVDISPENDN